MKKKKAIKIIKKWRQGFELLSEGAKTPKAQREFDNLLDAIDVLIKEILEPYQRPPSSHLENNLIAVGYYKHEIDFGVRCGVAELSDVEFNKLLSMLDTAIKVAKDMRERKSRSVKK